MREIFLAEIRAAISGGKLLVAFLLMTTAFLISLGMMNQEYRKRADNYGESISLKGNELFSNQIFYYLDNGRPETSGRTTLPLATIKPPDPMIFFARGFDTEMRQGVDFFSTWPILDTNIQPEQEKNLLHLLFPAPDLLFMIKLLASLLAMLFAFDIICGERERGTLKLMLVTRASRSSIFAGKYLGGLVSIAVAFSAAFIVYLLALSILTPFSLNAANSSRVGLIYVASLLHIAVFFGLGALISALTRGTSASLVLSLFFWIVIALVMPGMASLAAQQFAPIDSEEHLSQSKFKKAREMEAAYTAAHPGSDVSRNGAYGVVHDEIRAQIVDEMQKLEDEHKRRKDLQVALTANLARVSPVGSLSHLFTSLSRTGLEDAMRYRGDLVNIRTDIEKQYQELLTDEELLAAFAEATWDTPKKAMDAIEGWLDPNRSDKFTVPSLADTMSAVWVDWLLLAFFALAPVALAYFRFIHYDPR